MNSQSADKVRQRRWRVALSAFVLIPLVPELVILFTSLLAQIRGCRVQSDVPCPVGLATAADVIRHALEAGSFVGYRFSEGIAAAWLVACYVFVTYGWSQRWSRLLLAFAISVLYSFAPYFGPGLSIDHLVNDDCIPNEGFIGPCRVYGGNVGSIAHDTVRLGWRIIAGAPIAYAAFLIFAVVVIAIPFFSLNDRTPSE